MRSVTEPRWLVMPKKLLGVFFTPHKRCTCDRVFVRRQNN